MNRGPGGFVLRRLLYIANNSDLHVVVGRCNSLCFILHRDGFMRFAATCRLYWHLLTVEIRVHAFLKTDSSDIPPSFVYKSYIQSKLDYSLSILECTTEGNLDWVQRIQNLCVRIVCNLICRRHAYVWSHSGHYPVHLPSPPWSQ